MCEFSTADGFVEISECLGDMIKYVANEPSVGLYYIQQHAQNAVPNVVSLRNNIIEKSRETVLQTEDLEDSITMMKSMKECGFPVVNEMIVDIKRSLATMSTEQPIRRLIQRPSSSFHIRGRTSSWGPTAWGPNAGSALRDSEKMGGFLSGIFKSAKEKAENLKWPQIDLKEFRLIEGEVPLSVPAGSNGLTRLDEETEELPISSRIVDELEEDTNLLSASDNFDEFKAGKEARLQEWLEESGSVDHKGTDDESASA
ncbi:hypothetical protein Nepgr_001276 [Nepenthes gracilis]|uniref:Uncharacterized protein n=1 Tax=Nepenthes gracilis TaxID=150966 RepID=A0AAD3P898_NEPGR|nr:hypothetical protein Nepgr_001276 [Nepenthes gracilis]